MSAKSFTVFLSPPNHFDLLVIYSKSLNKKTIFNWTIWRGFPQFKSSVPHKTATHFQPPKSLNSTPKTPQFNTPLSSTSKTPQFHTTNPHFPTGSMAFLGFLSFWWRFFGVELRGFWCETEVDLFLCGTDVLNWKGRFATEGYSLEIICAE